MSSKYEKDGIKYSNVNESFTKDQIKELKKCSDDLFYFAKKYVHVIHPTRGLCVFSPFEYQDKMLQSFLDYRKVIFLAGRQLGKSTVASIYLCWAAMFKNDQTILIASNTKDASKEILDRIKVIYENLPTWLKAGCKEFNKHSIVFDNGSRIITRATTANTGRGLSISILYVDELGAVEPMRKQSEFWSAIAPTLSTGGQCIITSTPKSDEDVFAHIWKGATNIFDDEGKEHPQKIGKNGFFAIKNIWSDHPERDEKWAEEQRNEQGEEKFLQEHCCEFVTDDETLINGIALENLVGMDPIKMQGKVKWFKNPKANNIYIVSLDPSMGVGRDCAAIQVFEMPSLKQVAEWKSNRTDMAGQLKVMRDILIYLYEEMEGDNAQYNEPELYWSFENNSLGEGISSLIKEFGEDNFPGELIHEPITSRRSSSARRMGFNTTNKSKMVSCSKLKRFIEKGKLEINSKELIRQLKFFVSRGASFSAKPGEEDDLVMALILTIRMIERISKYDDGLEDIIKDAIDDDDYIAPMPFIIS